MANTDTAPAKVKRTKKAEHEYVDAQGNEVDTQDEAHGYQYTLVGAGDEVETFEWNYDEATDFEKRMTSLFGVKTLATNEASQVRNNAKIKGTDLAGPKYQMAAVIDRFKQLRDNGVWTTEREGGGVVTDWEKFATAICDYLVASGKRTEAEIKSGGWEKIRSQLEDKEYRSKARNNQEVMNLYVKLVGKPQTSVDDLDVI